jgi:hypothetical protein
VASTLVSGVRHKDATELISRLMSTFSAVSRISGSHGPLLKPRSLGKSCKFSCEPVASFFRSQNGFLLCYVFRLPKG